MTKRIPRAVREQAAMICAIAASNNGTGTNAAAIWLGLAVSRYDDDSPPQRLARACFFSDDIPGDAPRAEVYAEAESLLRTGWSPK